MLYQRSVFHEGNGRNVERFRAHGFSFRDEQQWFGQFPEQGADILVRCARGRSRDARFRSSETPLRQQARHARQGRRQVLRQLGERRAHGRPRPCLGARSRRLDGRGEQRRNLRCRELELHRSFGSGTFGSRPRRIDAHDNSRGGCRLARLVGRALVARSDYRSERTRASNISNLPILAANLRSSTRICEGLRLRKPTSRSHSRDCRQRTNGMHISAADPMRVSTTSSADGYTTTTTTSTIGPV